MLPDGDDADPRRARSRTRLLDAAAHLLSTGGVEAVTIEAVTKASKVARTTLYRHFTSSSHLLAATFERLLPQVTPPLPSSVPLREQLIELLTRQATLFAEAPLHLTTLAWVSLGPMSRNGERRGRTRSHSEKGSSTNTDNRSTPSCRAPKRATNSTTSTSNSPCANSSDHSPSHA